MEPDAQMGYTEKCSICGQYYKKTSIYRHMLKEHRTTKEQFQREREVLRKEGIEKIKQKIESLRNKKST